MKFTFTFPLRKSDPASIDNFAFKLHYRATFVVLLICMALVSARQYIGDPIQVREHQNRLIFIYQSSKVHCGWSSGGSNGPLLLDPFDLLRSRVRLVEIERDRLDRWVGIDSDDH